MNYKNYYEILELEYPSTSTEIKNAYKKAALKWHPDRNIEQELKRCISLGLVKI